MVQLDKILHRYTKKKALSMLGYIFIRNRMENRWGSFFIGEGNACSGMSSFYFLTRNYGL
ncbi:hypothetical protein ABE41_000890 [Fictibacillus arsenicus]|uniref:Uncharacterized protein n=1 Tax=Fictibacillus arsenicus TaxID=255247 RepID=A0A1B1YZI0_9BACL|nr:hypothetical protein ABE41_000890 [Fictibacillus arsenicus]